ncbi:MAG: extracellular solute-binding protein [Chloroflexota bacterium]|nr:extracellular solute-binding protein [Chloroflexota bacterium]
MAQHRQSKFTSTSTLTRRSFLGISTGFGGLVLSGCGSDDDAVDAVATIEILPTPLPTQAPAVPTQPPIASPVAGYRDPRRWAGRSITVASPALGEYLDAMTQAFFDAFAVSTGATVRHQEFGREGISSLIDQVEVGAPVWDVLLIPTEDVLPIAQGGHLQAIDYNVVDTAALYSELTMQHGVGARLYSTVIVYPSQIDDAPASWADFWDLERSQGTRALRRSPVGTLEFALLADGVAVEKLYPLDTTRAFSSLEVLREATLFYEDSKQPVELVRTGQVGLASAWSVRTALPDVVSLVKPQWNGGMIAADSWVLPRGGPNTDVAMSFVNFATRAVPTANFSRLQNFGPVNTDAFALLRPDIAAGLPNHPENLRLQFFQNWSYWAEFREPLMAQFEDWLLNPPSSPVVLTSPANA